MGGRGYSTYHSVPILLQVTIKHISVNIHILFHAYSTLFPPSNKPFRAALDWAWDPYDFWDVYDHFDVRFVDGKWRMVDEEGDFMHNDSGSE